MPHRKRHEAAEARINQRKVRLGRRAHPGAVYRHGQLLAATLRALQPAPYLVIRNVAIAVPGQLFERHKASVPAVAAGSTEEHAPAFGYGRERRHSRLHVSTDKAQRQCRRFAKYLGALLFRVIRTRRTPLYTPIFESRVYRTTVTAKNDNGNGRPPRPRTK